jgi:signal peptidase II
VTVSPRARVFWPLLAVALTTDCTTKELADHYLQPENVPHDVVGSVVRLTLAHNPYAGMGVSFGAYSRVAISCAVILCIVLLARMYRATPAAGRLRAAALALVMAGAVGNLSSRLVSGAGVTDFLDLGFGQWRFYTFNVADVSVFCGAVLLLRALNDAAEPPPAPDAT